jgi:1,4-dihydroxy-2-naphthoate octaprenyltransferase
MKLKDEYVLSVGMISFVIGIFIGRFVYFEYSGFSITDFIEGVLFGLSLVMNLYYLLMRSRKINVKI